MLSWIQSIPFDEMSSCLHLHPLKASNIASCFLAPAKCREFHIHLPCLASVDTKIISEVVVLVGWTVSHTSLVGIRRCTPLVIKRGWKLALEKLRFIAGKITRPCLIAVDLFCVTVATVYLVQVCTRVRDLRSMPSLSRVSNIHLTLLRNAVPSFGNSMCLDSKPWQPGTWGGVTCWKHDGSWVWWPLRK